MDAFQYIAQFHAMDLRAEADRHRLARASRPATGQRRPIAALYARLWWASRPRATTWAPALLDLPAR